MVEPEGFASPCCIKWQRKYTELKGRQAKLEKGRNALKEGVKILEKACEGEKARADLERKKKEEESAMRVTLENQLDTLKIECQMLQQNDSSSSQNLNGDVQHLEERILEGEKEINLLKELIEKEKLRTNAEKKRADAEKKRAECERKKANDALTKVEEDKKLTDLERKTNEENRVQLESLKTEFAQVKLNLEDTVKQLEIERLRADSEQKRAESEKNRADEAVKKIKDDKRDVNDVRKSSEEYRVQLEVLKAEIVQVKSNFEETKKQLDIEKTRADSEKKRAESVKKKATEAEKKVKEVLSLADVERKKSEESRVQLSVLMAEKCQLTTDLEETKKQLEKEKTRANAEKKRADADNKIYEFERKRTNEAEKKIKEGIILADVERKKFEESRVQLEALKKEFIQVKSVLEETKKQLEKEKTRADEEKKQAESDRKKGSEAVNKTKEDNGLLDSGKKKSNENKIQLEVLKTGTVGVKEDSEENKSQQVNGSRNSRKRKKCGEFPVIERYDQSNVVDIYWKKAKDEKCRADTLTLQLEKERERNLELEREISELVTFEKADPQKSGNTNKQPTKVNNLVEQLYQEVDNNKHRIQEMQSVIDNLLSSKNLLTSPVPVKNSEPESAKIKSLRKKVKFEKMMVKHAKQVAALEVGRNNILQYELGRLKQEILKFSEHLDILDNPAFKSDAGIAGHGKLCSLPVKRKHSHKRPHPTNLWKNGINDLLANPELLGSCNGLELSNNLRLFDLDNEEDERSFCAAMERPLSPSLPVLELKHHNTADARGSEDSLDNNFHVRRSTIHGDTAKCGSFDVIEVEIDSNKRSKSCFGNSTRHQLEKPDGVTFQNRNLDGFEEAVISQITDLRFCRTGESSPQVSDTVNIGKESHGLFKTDVSLTCSSLPRYLIVYPDIEDAASISRICGAVGHYMSHCTITSSSNYVKESLIILARDEGLSSKEKVCTFVTAILQKINEDMIMNSGTSMGSDFCQFIVTSSNSLNTVLSDIKMKKIMMDLWDLSDLVNIVGDFLINRRAMLFTNASSNIIKSATLDGNVGIPCAQEAPISMLVAGAALLATICASFDDVGFVCQVSYHIMRTQKANSSLVLIILHVFAHICGRKYFGEEFGLVVNVIRSLVVYLERLNSSDTISSWFPCLFEAPYNLWSCYSCPFLHDASSTDVVVPLLLKELHSYIINSIETLGHLDPISLAKYGANMFGMDNFKDARVETAFENFDVFSLLELVACFMSWDWSFNNIVCPVLEMLESCAMDFFSAVLITFLGQLGRIGVEAHGYDDAKVESLRSRFSTFLTRTAMGNSGFLIQLASATALSGLTPLSFEELVNNDYMTPATAVSLKNWFFSLSNEQQSSCKIELFSCLQE